MDYIIVLCTINNLDEAKKISYELLSKKLIACSNIIPHVTSIYEWENKIVEDNEYLMLFKSKQNLFEAIKEKITELHPYDVPEIISIKPDDGSDAYLKWLDNSVII